MNFSQPRISGWSTRVDQITGIYLPPNQRKLIKALRLTLPDGKTIYATGVDRLQEEFGPMSFEISGRFLILKDDIGYEVLIMPVFRYNEIPDYAKENVNPNRRKRIKCLPYITFCPDNVITDCIAGIFFAMYSKSTKEPAFSLTMTRIKFLEVVNTAVSRLPSLVQGITNNKDDILKIKTNMLAMASRVEQRPWSWVVQIKIRGVNSNIKFDRDNRRAYIWGLSNEHVNG